MSLRSVGPIHARAPAAHLTDKHRDVGEQREAWPFIVGIDLVAQAEVSGIEVAKFQSIAADTKKGCPVSRALAAVEHVTLNATLKTSA